MPRPAPGNAVLAQNILVCCWRPAANTAGWMRARAHYWTAGLMGWPESCNIVISEYYGLHNIVLRITPSPWVALAWPHLDGASKGFNRISSGVNISFFVNTCYWNMYIFLRAEFLLTGIIRHQQRLSSGSGSGVKPTSEGQRWASAAGAGCQSSGARESRAGIRRRSPCQITWHPRCRVKCSHSDAGKKRWRCKSGH